MALVSACPNPFSFMDFFLQVQDQALYLLDNPFLWLSCLIGVTLGILWGAMPGLSTTMAMTLLLGLTTGMSQAVAIIFMLGVYTGSVFGGAISAVLINIPGTPDAVPTMIEGYPLTLKGEGGLALGTAISASFIGNWIGIILLILLIPGVLFFALQFRSWEMFLLALWGIAICGSMSTEGSPIKGWISGCIGLIISFVGLDAIYGVPRMSFGSYNLEDGISFIPVLIGLFGLSEVLQVLPQKDSFNRPTNIGRILPSFNMLKKYIKPSIRSGLIGTLVGAIPGAGANIASFLSYDIGRRRASKDEKKLWGKGSYEAVVCSEVGPLIQIENPGLIFYIFLGLIVANFFMYGMAVLLIKPCVRLFGLPKSVLMPLVIPMCILGAFAVSLNYFDVYVMLVSGIVGFVLHKLKFPLAPIILGIILGPMIDENLRRSLLIFQDQGMLNVLWDRKIGTILLSIVAYTFYDGIFRSSKESVHK
jgi:putative tricarboxylic transport membrane protein